MSQGDLFTRGDALPPVLYSGVTPTSRTASREAGETNRRSGAAQTQRAQLLALYLRDRGTGVTDADASETLGIRRHVVPARRAELMKVHRIVAMGRRGGSTAWRLT